MVPVREKAKRKSIGRRVSLPRHPAGKSLQRKFLDLSRLVLLIGILISVGLLSAIAGMRFAVRRTEVEVPPLVGLVLVEAEEAAAGVDLGVQVSAERYDAEVPAGNVISQYPAAGGRLKAERHVQVIVSLGQRTSPVPKLIGSTLRVAKLTAEQYNYEVGFVGELALEGTEKGTVVQQYPPAAWAEASSPKIDILVSKGPPRRFIMPDMTGQSLNRVQPFLEEEGFSLASVEYQFYRNVTKGTVVKQFPEPGHLLSEEDSIHLEVAR